MSRPAAASISLLLSLVSPARPGGDAPLPSPRDGKPALASDDRGGRVLLFGGSDATGTVPNDLRSLDGTGWLQLDP